MGGSYMGDDDDFGIDNHAINKVYDDDNDITNNDGDEEEDDDDVKMILL